MVCKSLERRSDMGGLTGGDNGPLSPCRALESRNDELGTFPASCRHHEARLELCLHVSGEQIAAAGSSSVQ